MHVLLIYPNLTSAKQLQKQLRYENIGSDIMLCPQSGEITPKKTLIKLFSETYQAVICYHQPPHFDAFHHIDKIRELKPALPINLYCLKTDPVITKMAEKNGTKLIIEPTEPALNWITRLKKLCNCVKRDKDLKIIRYRDLTLDLETRVLTKGKNQWDLKNKEFALMEFFLLNAGIVLKRNTILDHVWDRNANILTNTVDVHVSRLRKKIDPEGKGLIRTMFCAGYMLE